MNATETAVESETLTENSLLVGAGASARRPFVEPTVDDHLETVRPASDELDVDDRDVNVDDVDVDADADADVVVVDVDDGGIEHAESEAPATHTFKILVTGPFAAGKTSLIQSISQTDVVSTDVVTSGDESDVKEHTTVAMDFGTYRLDDDDINLLLFGTPGQSRFRFMTNILKGDVDIVAFVIDADARHTHAAAGVELRSLLSDLRVPAVIAVNRCDDQDVADRMARSLGALAGEAVVPCQLVDPDSGRDVIVEVLLTLLDSMELNEVDCDDG